MPKRFCRLKHYKKKFCVLLLWAGPSSAVAFERLPWPLELNHWPHQFGANTQQFVSLGSTYYHNGQDILADVGQKVFAPVSGQVEAGFYTYEDKPSGFAEKTFLSLKDYLNLKEKPSWVDEFYFEVAVVDNHGRRYELHHIDRRSLPKPLLDKVFKKEQVELGDFLGRVMKSEITDFGIDYHHIHYNIYDSKFGYLNPFYFSKPIKDTSPPYIGKVYTFREDSGRGCKFKRGPFLHLLKDKPNLIQRASKKLVFNGHDKITGNTLNVSLTKIEVYFEGSKPIVYDFSKGIGHLAQHAHDIRDVYFKNFCIGDPSFPISLEGSTNVDFYYQVEIPKGFQGDVKIVAFDSAGNMSYKSYKLKGL